MDIYEQLNENSGLIYFAIHWGPTLLFLLGMIIGSVFGFIHGLRKSVILFIMNIVTAMVSIILFFVFVKVKAMDIGLVSFINLFLGDNGLQQMIGAPESYTSLRECISYFILHNIDFMDSISLILEDNGTYFAAMVDLAYRIMIALVIYVNYILLSLLSCIIYLIFFSKKKDKLRVDAKYSVGLKLSPYRPRRLWGALVGASRHMVRGIVGLSFLGTLFFILAGGTSTEYKEKQIDDPAYSFFYNSVYQNIGSYGEDGIFKILNICKDKNDVPYYLYVADLVLQGEYKNEYNQTSNVILRDELAAYTKFSRKTLDLVLEYGKEDIDLILAGEYSSDVWGVITNVLAMPGFQQDFKQLIIEFEDNSYILNFTLAFIDSAVKNIDSLYIDGAALTSNMSVDAAEILRILFVPGHKSQYIPYEAKLKEENPDAVLDYIKPSKLLHRDDVYVAYDIFLDYLNCANIYGDDSNLILKMLNTMIPDIKRLSITSSTRKTELNPVLQRLYAFTYNVYLSQELDFSSGETEEPKEPEEELNSLSSKVNYVPFAGYSEDIDWVAELSMLLDTTDKAITLYSRFHTDETTALDYIFFAYDKTNRNYKENSVYMDAILANFESSQVLSRTLGTKMVQGLLFNSLYSISGEFEIGNVNYGNTFDKNGHLISYGETYKIFAGLRTLALNQNNRENLSIIFNGSDSVDYIDAFEGVVDGLLDTRATGVDAVDLLLDSEIISKFISSYLISNTELTEGIKIYIDDSLYEVDSYGMKQNSIDKEELKQFFYSLPSFFDVIELFAKEEKSTSDILEALSSDTFLYALESKLLEGTISESISSSLSSTDTLVIPKNITYKVTSKYHDSEVRVLASIKSKGIDFESFTKEYATDSEKTNSITKAIRTLTEEQINYMLSSDIMAYTISDYLIKNGNAMSSSLPIIIPTTAKTATEDGILINKRVIGELLLNLDYILPKENESFDVSNFIYTIIIHPELLDNSIVVTTMVNAICNDDEVKNSYKDSLVIPTKYLNAGSKDILENNYTKYNIWNTELKYFILSLDELLGIEEKGYFNISDSNLTNDMYKSMEKLNEKSKYTEASKLDYIANSDIMIATISSKIDDLFLDKVTMEERATGKTKDTGYYTKEEIQGLVDSIECFGIQLQENFDTQIITDKIKDELITYNVPNDKNREGKSTLSLVYKSVIVRALFSHEINDLDIIEATKRPTVQDKCGAYYEEEISSLIDTLRFAGYTSLPDKNDDVSNKLTTMTDTLLAKNSSYPSITNLEYLYFNKIFGIIMTSNLEKNSEVSVPTDSYEKKVSGGADVYITCHEALNLLRGMKSMGISLTDDFSVKYIQLESLDPTTVSESMILSNAIYNAISGDNIVVPYIAITDSMNALNVYIKQQELFDFLTVVKEKKDILFKKDSTGNYDITSITIESDKVNSDFLRSMNESYILTASTIHVILTDSDLNKSLHFPSVYLKEGTKTNLEHKEENVWFREKELSHLADAFDAIGLTDLKYANDNEDFIKDQITPAKLLQPSANFANEKNIDVIYHSRIFASTVTDTIQSNLSHSDDMTDVNCDIYEPVFKSPKIYNEYYEAYTHEETCALLEAYNVLGIDLNDMSGYKIESIYSYSKDERKTLYQSILMRGVFTSNVYFNFYNNPKLQETMGGMEPDVEVYRASEFEEIIRLFKDKGDIQTIQFNDFKIDTLKSSIEIEDGECKSYCILASMSKHVVENKDMVVPMNVYTRAYHTIFPAEMLNLMDAYKALGCETVTINFSSVKIPKSDTINRTIAKSKVMCASFVKNINISSGSSTAQYVVNKEEYVSLFNDYSSEKIVLLTEDEAFNLLRGISILGSESFSFQISVESLKKLTSSDLSLVFTSKTLQATISKILSTGITYNGLPTIPLSNGGTSTECVEFIIETVEGKKKEKITTSLVSIFEAQVVYAFLHSGSF